VRRCFATLIVQGGGGSYIAPQHELRPVLPDYVSTAIPLLCSLRRVGSSYPIVVLAVNITHAESKALGAHGAIVRDVSALAAQQHMALPIEARSCKLDTKGSWQVWGRGDFAQTMVKALLWKELAELGYDEVAYVDGDSIFLAHPDAIFDVLDPVLLGRQSRAHRTLALRDMGRCKRRGDKPGVNDYRHRRLCPRLSFVARFSSRHELTKEWIVDRSRSACVQPGWQSGFFVARPSVRTYEALVRRARSGNFSTFTQTEQDVLDAEFDIRQHCLPLRAPKEGAAECVAHAYVQHDLVEQLVLHHKLHARRPDASPTEQLGTTAVHNLSLALCQSREHLEHLPTTVAVLGSLSKCQHWCRESRVVGVAAALLAGARGSAARGGVS